MTFFLSRSSKKWVNVKITDNLTTIRKFLYIFGSLPKIPVMRMYCKWSEFMIGNFSKDLLIKKHFLCVCKFQSRSQNDWTRMIVKGKEEVAHHFIDDVDTHRIQFLFDVPNGIDLLLSFILSFCFTFCFYFIFVVRGILKWISNIEELFNGKKGEKMFDWKGSLV